MQELSIGKSKIQESVFGHFLLVMGEHDAHEPVSKIQRILFASAINISTLRALYPHDARASKHEENA